ncbi:MAG: YraN family protein [candidate division Zixibacteria bacterium]|nr:YraN family protein [candidate division Zixibacteria bacterium]
MHSSEDGPQHRRNTVRKGREFEEHAARFFTQQGFEVIERNWQAGHKEIDLVVRRGGLIVFVEVKAARSKNFGHPSEWIDRKKIDNLLSAARQYIEAHDITNCDLRFDVVTFFQGKLEHYPGAFTAD